MTRLVFILMLVLSVCPAVARAGEWDGVAFPQPTVAAGDDHTRAWLVLPTRMVFDDADLPAEVAGSAAYEIRAARNETECVQLVVMRATPAGAARVEFTDFAGDGGSNLPPSAWSVRVVGQVPGQIPARSADVIKTWKTSTDAGGSAGPDTYSPSASKTVPDPLLPAKPLKLDNGLTRLWLTVRVPKDAKPGAYRGKVRVSAGDRLLLEVPLTVRVWNHVLPDEPSLFVLANVWSNRPPGQDEKSKPLWEQLKPYYDDLKAHRVNATGEIYPPPIWKRQAPPPDTTEYEAALKYVLDDLNFARFRFPGLAGAAGGKWQAEDVFEPAPPQVAGATWISGAAFTASNPPAATAAQKGQSPHWARVGGRSDDFGGATLAGYTQADDDAWVEYEFESTAMQPLYVYVQVDPVRAKEKMLVRIDGSEAGTIDGRDFLRNPLGFASLPQPVKLKPGKHAIRVNVATDVSGGAGAADPIYGILLTPYATPDLDQVLRDRATLREEFKSDVAYHARQAAEWLRQHKWLKKAQAKLKDEPAVAEYARVGAVYDYVGDVLPSVRRELSEQPVGPLRKSVEVWAPTLGGPRFDPDGWQAQLRPMDELWGYHNFLHTLGYPSVSMRILPLLVGRHGLKGYVFYAVNAWPADPWTETGPANSFLRGTLIYPDPKTGAPIDSVRWELFREGLEDVETLRLLRQALDAAEAGDAVKISTERRAAVESGEKLFGETLPTLIRSARDFSWDPAALESARTRAGEALSALTPP